MQTLGIKALISASALATLAACGPADEVTIDLRRDLGSDAALALPDATAAQRFTNQSSGEDHSGHNHAPGEGHGEPEVPFLYKVPDGWTELAAGGQRWINLQPGGNPDASCYLTILGGEGGGLTANVNRWLGQLGLDPLDDAGVAALPTVLLLGQPATLVEGKGHFTGMGDQARDDWGLLGLVQTMRVPSATGEEQVFTAFIKMTGPAALIEQERPGFEAFYQSLTPRDSGENADHAQHSDSGAAAAPVVSNANAPLVFTAPPGWTDAGASGMRLISLKIGAASECYVIRLASDGGGLEGNVNRWRGQLGLDPLSAPALDAMPRVECLGTEAVLFDATGSYTGMSGEAHSSARMLGALVFMGDRSYFIKFVGPVEEVTAEEAHFKTFLASLEFGS